MSLQIGTQIAGPDRLLTGDNFDEVIRTLADVGFDGVELTWYPTHYPEEEPFGTYFGHSPADLADLFELTGMETVGSHVLLPDLQSDLQDAIDFHRAAACDRLGLVELPEEYFESRETLSEAVSDVREMAGTVADAGMELYLHNHDHEFEVHFDGESGFEALVRELGDEVALQIDLSHVRRTGNDPIEVLRTLESNVSSLHVSDMDGGRDVPMGEGDLDYDWVVDFARERDIDWLILEEKSNALDERDPLSVIRQDYEYLESLVAA